MRAESVGKVCPVQVLGQEPLNPGKQSSPRAPYHGKWIPCPGMAQDGIVPDMRICVRSQLQRYRKQNSPFFLLNTTTGIQQCCNIPQYSRQLLHSKPRSMHNGLLGGNSQIRDNVIGSNCFKMS